jgi:phytanoyl-CoA hydroxylase
MSLSSYDLEQYKRDGYLLVPQFLDAKTIEAQRQTIESYVDQNIRHLLEAGKIESAYEGAPFETRWALVSQQLEEPKDRPSQWGGRQGLISSSIFDLYTHSHLTKLIALILGPEVTAHGDYWIRCMTKGKADRPLRWHQDSTYFLGQNDRDTTIDYYPPETILTVWIPLVNVGENNGCLRLVKGSNQHGAIPFQRDNHRQWEPTREVSDYGTVTPVPMRAGDVLIFNNLTLHTGGNNATTSVRWSIDLRYSPTGQSFDWHQMGEEVNKRYPVFVARSEDPAKQMSWTQWLKRWRATPDWQENKYEPLLVK